MSSAQTEPLASSTSVNGSNQRILLAHGDPRSTFMWLAVVLCGWFVVALTMKPPRYLSSRIVSLRDLRADEVKSFVDKARQLDGVHEVAVYEADRVAYLKVEKHFDQRALDALVAH